jgi:Beta-lactamase enzyme family
LYKNKAGTAIAIATVSAFLFSASPAGAAAAARPSPASAAQPAQDAPVSAVARQLQKTMDRLQFQQVLDLAPPGSAQAKALSSSVNKDARTPRQLAHMFASAAAPQPIVQQPQIDATVLELDKRGRIVSSGTVLMSPQYPHGVVVPVDQDFHTSDVRWRQWDDSGWYTNHGQGTIDVVPGRENAPIDFMLPYPASVLKLMVNFGVLQLVDKGEIKLDDTYNYQPTAISPLCGGATSNTIRQYMDASLTWSSNAASCALIKLLWDHNAIDSLNQTFQGLGLETLQLNGTNPANGGHWANPVTMSSLDTAKLLALINGAPGTIWTAPDGTPVTSAVLSPYARRFFKRELGQQGWNWMLSTPNYCGAAYPTAGIPQVTPKRWIAADGTVTVKGSYFGQDVRPCNRTAQVTFAHKTGWVSNSGADAGIVQSLPGKPFRRYIIAVFSNLGDQYQDPNRPPTPPGVIPVEFTQKLAQLGLAIDQYETEHSG